MKNWAFILCIAMLSASCSSILSSKPSDILSEKQMTDVLVDISLTEATLKIANDSLARVNDTTEMRKRFAEVFRKYNIEPDDFNTSLTYYLKHIDELDKIYVEVINRLTAMEAALMPLAGPDIGSANRLSPGQFRDAYKNPWYRSMNKKVEPVEIQYFDPARYPLTTKKKIPYPGPLE